MTTIGALATGVVRPLKAERHGDRSAASIAFLAVLWFTLLFAVAALAALLVTSFVDGIARVDGNLFTNYASQLRPETGGARAAILGSLWVVGTTAVLALPLGVAAAVYLEEFADPARWYNRLIEVNLQNLAAVPAIIYGMLTAGFALAIGLRRGVVVEDGRLVHIALFQAHALAVLEVDRGKEDHGCQPRKLAISFRPSVWLFSGWN